jgi:hypothetical protein
MKLFTLKTNIMRKAITTKALGLLIFLSACAGASANYPYNDDNSRIVVIRSSCEHTLEPLKTLLVFGALPALPDPVKLICIRVIDKSCKQKIDFNNLNAEMDQSQEDMSRMDPALAAEDQKNRKAAEEILKAGTRF